MVRKYLRSSVIVFRLTAWQELSIAGREDLVSLFRGQESVEHLLALVLSKNGNAYECKKRTFTSNCITVQSVMPKKSWQSMNFDDNLLTCILKLGELSLWL